MGKSELDSRSLTDRPARRRSPLPQLLAQIPFEGAPTIRIAADSAADYERVLAWVTRRPDWLRALDLLEGEQP